jgi:cellobiose transport system substrate-binding protein
MKLKKIAAGLALAGLVIGSAASSATAAATEEKVLTTKTITIWTFGDVIEANLIKEYKKVHPEILLSIKKSDLAQMNGTDMVAACTSKTGPDIVAVEVSYSGKWRSYPKCFTDLKTMRTSSANATMTTTFKTHKNTGSADLYYDLDDKGARITVPNSNSYIDATGAKISVGSIPAGQSATTIKPNYLSWRWAQGVGHDGSVIGIPTDVGGLEVLYRTDLMVKAGLITAKQSASGEGRDILGKSWPTWDKFIAQGQKYMLKLSAADKKKGFGFMDNAGAIFAAMLQQGETKYYNDNGTDSGTIFGVNPKTKKKEPLYSWNPNIKAAWDTTIKATKAGIGTKTAQFSPDWPVGMNTGKFAAILAPAWMMDYVKQQAPTTTGKWDVADLPGGGGNQGGTQLGITSYSTMKQDAWDFLAWYLAPDQQLQVFRSYGLFPSTKSIYNNSSVKDFKDPFFNNAPVGKIYSEGILKLKPIFEGELNPAIDLAFGGGLTRVAAGKMNSAKSWDKVMKDLVTATRGAK